MSVGRGNSLEGVVSSRPASLMGQLKLILPAEKAANHHDKGKVRSHSLTAAELAVVQRFAPPMPARRDPPVTDNQVPT